MGTWIRSTAVRYAGSRRGATPTRRRPAAALAAVVMSLAACAGATEAGGPPTSGATAGGTEAPAPTVDPADPDVPLLRVHSAGGFLPFGWDFARVPEITVYPDGQAVTHGPQIEIYPPPALPNLVVRAVPEDALDALVDAARDAGLLDDASAEYGRPNVADAGTTFVTLQVDGRTYEHAAEALSVVDGIDGMDLPPGAEGAEVPGQPPEAPSPESAAAWGLTEEQLRARAELAGFLAQARELVGAAEETGPYAIEAFAVMAQPAPDPTGPDAPEEELVPQVFPWPLDLPLADAASCVLVAGEDARTLHDLLVGAGFTAQFEQAGARYEAWFRPLLPHEDGCDDVAG